MFPAFLYQVDAKSLAGALLEHTRRSIRISAAAAVIDTLSNPAFAEVPVDKMFVIKHVAMRWLEGAGQAIQAFEVYDTDASGVTRGIIGGMPWATYNIGAAIEQTFALACEYVLRPGHHIVARATFDLGVNPNVLDLTVAGWTLPRGNVNL